MRDWSRRHTLAALLAAGGSTLPMGWVYAQARKAEAAPLPGDYMGKGLRDRVEALKAEAATTPTGDANYRDRGLLLYDWMNAYAMTGVYLHPEMPSVIAALYSPAFAGNGERQRKNAFSGIDRFIRTLEALEANPKIIGTVSARTEGPLTVDSYAQFEQTYTVGEASLSAGGGVVLPNHFYFASEELQTWNPKADNYVTVRASNPAVKIAPDTYPITGMFSSQLGVVEAQRVFFRIIEGTLRPGETLTVTYGDKSQGSRGLKLIHISSTALRFPFWVQTSADGLLLTPREATLPVRGGPAAGVRGFGPAVVAVGEPFRLSVRAEDIYRNLASGGAPGWRLMLNGEIIRRLPASGDAITVVEGLTLARPGPHRFEIISEDGRIRGGADPILAETKPVDRIYWGETHGHCGFSEGMGLVDDYFNFARDEARLDFCALSEHDIWLDAWEWEEMRRAAIKANRPGEFITYVGYEWTVVSAFGGHHNVIFRDLEKVTPVSAQRHPTLPDLYRGLRKAYATKDVIVIPHAHMTADATQNDPDLEPLVEIVSEHGTFEWLGRRYLASGFQLGFVGASDNHIGHPGYKPRPLGRYYFDGYGGLAAVYAPAKDRHALFDAMKARRTYATNGARILLKAAINGRPMGQVVPKATARVLEGVAHGTAPVESITLVKNGQEVQTLAYDAVTADAHDDIIEIRFASTSEPNQRLVPSRNIRAWEGRIEVTGATIAQASSPQVEALNVFTEWVLPDPLNASAARFRLVTRGDAKSIRLKLAGDISKARIKVLLPNARTPFNAETAVPGAGAPAVLVAKDRVPAQARTSGGEFDDTISVRRIRPAVEMDRAFRFEDTAPPVDGDNYYVRITQADGGQAWSSPAWVGAVKKPAAKT
jgi:hypothetical protein